MSHSSLSSLPDSPSLCSHTNPQHFKNTLRYIQSKQRQTADRDREGEDGEDEDEDAAKPVDWSAVDVIGGCLKMSIN